ncbi:MAG: hypothetical protein ACOX7N_08175 [Lawsonibacter sp.]|jgi:hypothetical protein
MLRTVIIDGREVPLRASASIPRLYRIKFRRDIMQDMVTIRNAVEKASRENGKVDLKQAGERDETDGWSSEAASSIPMECLEMFENVAYLMAKHADPNVPGTVEEWLDGFDTFSIYAVFPVISEMWDENVKTMSVPAKK